MHPLPAGRRSVANSISHALAPAARGTRLRSEGLSIREAADRVGYEADAAFSRAFNGQFGVPPGEYRQHAVSAT
jgi:AraC family transcriptional regulator, alkane utilization regulator